MYTYILKHWRIEDLAKTGKKNKKEVKKEKTGKMVHWMKSCHAVMRSDAQICMNSCYAVMRTDAQICMNSCYAVMRTDVEIF